MKIILLFTLNIHKDGFGRDGSGNAGAEALYLTRDNDELRNHQESIYEGQRPYFFLVIDA